jgi:hypothetical protein
MAFEGVLMLKFASRLVAVVTCVLVGARGALSDDQSPASKTLALWNAARAACSSTELDPSPRIPLSIPLAKPVKAYRNEKPRYHVIFIPNEECPRPSESVVFLTGHGLNRETNIGYTYATSPRGQIIEVVRFSYIAGRGLQYEPVSQITPAIQSDFDQLVRDLIEAYGAR